MHLISRFQNAFHKCKIKDKRRKFINKILYQLININNCSWYNEMTYTIQ